MHTEYNVNIDKRVKEGLTEVFEDKIEAQKAAKQKRSYCYPVFKYDKRGRTVPCGYGVPK